MQDDKKIFAVIDTNVLVSALYSSKVTSQPLRVVQAVIDGYIIPLYNSEIIEKYKDVLSRAKFNFKPELINNLLSVFIELGLDTCRTPVLNESFPDKDDMVFYEVALTVKDSYVVTGNIKHFPVKPFIVTPAEMVEILRNHSLID